jgi:hypothetical protein
LEEEEQKKLGTSQNEKKVETAYSMNPELFTWWYL